MGVLNPRLEKMYSAIQPQAALAIIVSTNVDPATLLATVARLGTGPISYVSTFSKSFGTTATETVARAIAQLPGVDQVFPDEPIHAV